MPTKKEIVSSFLFVIGAVFFLVIFKTVNSRMTLGTKLNVTPLLIGFVVFMVLAYVMTNKLSRT